MYPFVFDQSSWNGPPLTVFYQSSYRKLLEFQLNDESGEIYESTATDSPPWARRLSTAELNGGKSRFLWIWTYRPEGVVFDTRTRKFYELPPSRIPLVCGGLYEWTSLIRGL